MYLSDYKTYHESFMKNNHGSNALHTFFCIFFTVQCTLLCAIREKRSDQTTYVYEYLIIVLPLILIHTILAEYIYLMNVFVSLLLLYNIVQKISHLNPDTVYDSNKKESKRLHTTTCIRGLTYLITSVCILAVDFKDFPRYLAKTENYGYSLMDTGVGLFVLISGLVHKDLRTNSLSKILISNLKFISILLVLGVSRYVSIKQLDYHEHVTEYGVHWNFFFTLAFCKLFSTIILLFTDKTLVVSLIILAMHELLLYNGLKDWVFSSSPRITLLEANREGISSNLGYIFLYIFAVHIKKKLSIKNVKEVLYQLIIYSVFFVMLSYLVNVMSPTSRTLANAGYCIFVTSIILVLLTIMYFLENFLSYKQKLHFQTPNIITEVNKNGLCYFLICNISTGFINMVFQTLLLSSAVTFVILNIYMILTLSITVYLNKHGLKIYTNVET